MIEDRTIRDLMRENSYRLVAELIHKQYPFRLVIWNNDNWDIPLPKEIVNKFPLQIILDFVGFSLQNSFIYEDNVFLLTSFEDEIVWTKQLEFDEIIAVLDLEGNPIQINNFPPEEDTPNSPRIENEKDLLHELLLEGIDKNSALKSINAFTL